MHHCFHLESSINILFGHVLWLKPILPKTVNSQGPKIIQHLASREFKKELHMETLTWQQQEAELKQHLFQTKTMEDTMAMIPNLTVDSPTGTNPQ